MIRNAIGGSLLILLVCAVIETHYRLDFSTLVFMAYT